MKIDINNDTKIDKRRDESYIMKIMKIDINNDTEIGKRRNELFRIDLYTMMPISCIMGGIKNNKKKL